MHREKAREMKGLSKFLAGITLTLSLGNFAGMIFSNTLDEQTDPYKTCQMRRTIREYVDAGYFASQSAFIWSAIALGSYLRSEHFLNEERRSERMGF